MEALAQYFYWKILLKLQKAIILINGLKICEKPLLNTVYCIKELTQISTRLITESWGCFRGKIIPYLLPLFPATARNNTRLGRPHISASTIIHYLTPLLARWLNKQDTTSLLAILKFQTMNSVTTFLPGSARPQIKSTVFYLFLVWKYQQLWLGFFLLLCRIHL